MKILFQSWLFMIVITLSAGNAIAADYVIGGGDTLRISVWGSPELSITTNVRPDGKISIPAVREVMARGLTPTALKELLQYEIRKLIKTPIVTVIVTEATNYRVYVIGNGVTPGVFTLKRETTLLQFLARLGSMESADLERAYLTRNKELIKTGFKELFEDGDLSQDIMLKPDDILFIPDNFDKRVSIVGEVETPATIPYRDGLRILDLIVAAEGFSQYANESRVEILRRNGSDKRTVVTVNIKNLKKGGVDNNVLIMPGDYIVVREGFF